MKVKKFIIESDSDNESDNDTRIDNVLVLKNNLDTETETNLKKSKVNHLIKRRPQISFSSDEDSDSESSNVAQNLVTIVKKKNVVSDEDSDDYSEKENENSLDFNLTAVNNSSSSIFQLQKSKNLVEENNLTSEFNVAVINKSIDSGIPSETQTSYIHDAFSLENSLASNENNTSAIDVFNLKGEKDETHVSKSIVAQPLPIPPLQQKSSSLDEKNVKLPRNIEVHSKLQTEKKRQDNRVLSSLENSKFRINESNIENRDFTPKKNSTLINMPYVPRSQMSNRYVNNLFVPKSSHWQQKIPLSQLKNSKPAFTLPQKQSNQKIYRHTEITSHVTSSVSNIKSDITALYESIPEDTEKEGDVNFDNEQPVELTVQLLRHQLEGVRWLRGREKTTGGILADMGLGKTLQTVSLILLERSNDPNKKTTLIITPVALLKQWEFEIQDKTSRNSLSVHIHHGNRRYQDSNYLKTFDIIITSYNIVSSEFNSKYGKGVLFDIDWYRIVLDEAQTIKNRQTIAAKGCYSLKAEKRLCLSGTPLQNTVEDLFSLIHFLKVKSYSDHSVFKSQISEPLNKGFSKAVAMKRLNVLLQALMLRRTKKTLINGKPLLNLPERQVTVCQLQFEESEKTMYENLETRLKSQVKALVNDGKKNVTNFLTLLLRLRQACNHPFLVGYNLTSNDEIVQTQPENDELSDLAAMVGSLNIEKSNCSICLISLKPEEISTCAACILALPKLTNSSESESEIASSTELMQSLSSNFKDSTKVKKMMNLVRDIYNTSSDEKIIIFSQFTKMLDICEYPLKKENYTFCRYDGSMANDKKEFSLKEFRTNPNKRVLLISLKCGSVGLNLVNANHVILLDIWWNPAVEDQAIDRVHRIGQTRNVKVTRLVIANTVEDRILDLQNKKRELIDGAIGDDTLLGNRKKSGRGGLDTKEILALFGF
ncbi:hypothetical protein HDU92_007392 [Lobulomyces angularis]|nr:hypothetical protein HDU92_007392 [Lobulomyces angularis]